METQTTRSKSEEKLDEFDAHRRNRTVQQGVITEIETDEKQATLTVNLLYGNTKLTHTVGYEEANEMLELNEFDPKTDSVYELEGVNVPVKYSETTDAWKVDVSYQNDSLVKEERSTLKDALSTLNYFVFGLKLSVIIGAIATVIGVFAGVNQTALLFGGVVTALLIGLKVTFTEIEMRLWDAILNEYDTPPKVEKHVKEYRSSEGNGGRIRHVFRLLRT